MGRTARGVSVGVRLPDRATEFRADQLLSDEESQLLKSVRREIDRLAGVAQLKRVAEWQLATTGGTEAMDFFFSFEPPVLRGLCGGQAVAGRSRPPLWVAP